MDRWAAGSRMEYARQEARCPHTAWGSRPCGLWPRLLSGLGLHQVPSASRLDGTRPSGFAPSSRRPLPGTLQEAVSAARRPSPALVARLSALRPVIASTGKSTPLPTPCRSLWHPERRPPPRRTTPPPTPAEAGRRLGVVTTVGFPAPAQSPAQSSSLRGISRFPG